MSQMLIDGLTLEGSTAGHAEYLKALRTGGKEPFTAELFSRALHGADTVIDGGAYLGFYSLLAARHIEPGGSVLAFEPNPVTFRLLCRNLEENGFLDRVIALPLGLDSATRQRSFYLGDHDAAKSSLFMPERWHGATEADCTSVDAALGSRPVDVVKLDIEGGEVEALRGMRRTLAASVDPCVIVECNPVALRRAGTGPDTLLSELEATGLKPLAIDEQGRELREVEDALAMLDGHVNLYCRRA